YTVLCCAAVVGVQGQAGGLCGLDEQVVERRHLLGPRDLDGAAAASVLVGADVGAFDLLEIRQQILVRPALATRFRPGVVVEALAAVVDHPVERAGATEKLPSGRVKGAPGQRLTG